MRPEKYIQAARSYLVATAQDRRHRQPGHSPRRPFLTLSRQAGAGAHTLGHRVVALLNEGEPRVPWALFDENLVNEVLKDHDLPSEFGRYLTEDRVAEINETIEVSLGLHPHKDHLVGKMNATILGLAKMGHVVLVGRGSHVLTRRFPGGVHVRLIADRDRRVHRIAEMEGLEERQALERVTALDAGRRAYVRRHFGGDIEDPMAYDMVINTSVQSIDAIAAMLVRRLQYGRFTLTPAAL